MQGTKTTPTAGCVWLTPSLLISTYVNKHSVGCVSLNDVLQALKKVQEVAAGVLESDETVFLLKVPKEQSISVDEIVYSLTADFSEIGHMLAHLLSHLPIETRTEKTSQRDNNDRRPTFSKKHRDYLVAVSDCCYSEYPSGLKWRYPPLSAIAKCYPQICVNIFSAISIGTLIGLASSGDGYMLRRRGCLSSVYWTDILI